MRCNGHELTVIYLDQSSEFFKYGEYQVVIDGCYLLKEFKRKSDAVEYVTKLCTDIQNDRTTK